MALIYGLVAALLAAVAVYAVSTAWTSACGAPWVGSSMDLVHRMLRMARVSSDDLVYDLGCGDGRVIITAARHYGARAVGLEIDPLRYLWCQLRITVLGLRGQVRVIFGSFFANDLSDADVVTCFLLQRTNDRLESKLLRELRPGTRVLSNTFVFSQLAKTSEDGAATLYVVGDTPADRRRAGPTWA